MAVPLVQLTRSVAGTSAHTGSPSVPARKPSWLKVKAPGGPNYVQIKTMMRELGLHTVCEEARCPNVGECWEHKAATFMILGDVCTRNCTYCAVSHGTPKAFDPLEPSPAGRGGGPDGSSARGDHLGGPRRSCRTAAPRLSPAASPRSGSRLPETSVEVLIPDFKGSERALQIVMDARPDILNHNLETAERLYRMARPGGRYDRALRASGQCTPHGSRWFDQVRRDSGHGRGVG